jgi:phosphate starvation-inducible protein PhoH
VVRHVLVQKIIQAYEQDEQRQLRQEKEREKHGTRNHSGNRA